MMRFDRRKVLLARVLLVLAVCLPLELCSLAADCWWLAALSLVPLGLMMPAGVLGGGGVNCTGACSTDATTFSLTVSGVADSSCSSCSFFNQTFVASFNALVSSTTKCVYAAGDVDAPCCSGAYSVTITLESSGGSLYIGRDVTTSVRNVFLDAGGGCAGSSYVDFDQVDIGASPLDCSAINETLTSVALSQTNGCDMSAAQMVVVGS